MCTYEKAIKDFELKVDVHKRPLRFKGKLTIDLLVSTQWHVSRSDYYEFMYGWKKCVMTFLLKSESGVNML